MADQQNTDRRPRFIYSTDLTRGIEVEGSDLLPMVWQSLMFSTCPMEGVETTKLCDADALIWIAGEKLANLEAFCAGRPNCAAAEYLPARRATYQRMVDEREFSRAPAHRVAA